METSRQSGVAESGEDLLKDMDEDSVFIKRPATFSSTRRKDRRLSSTRTRTGSSRLQSESLSEEGGRTLCQKCLYLAGLILTRIRGVSLQCRYV